MGKYHTALPEVPSGGSVACDTVGQQHLIGPQVEIKLRLPNKEAHDAVAAQLKDSFRETHQQENFFFDGVKGELSSQRVVLRCRFYNKDKRAIVTLKVLHSIIITAREPPIVTLKVLRYIVATRAKALLTLEVLACVLNSVSGTSNWQCPHLWPAHPTAALLLRHGKRRRAPHLQEAQPHAWSHRRRLPALQWTVLTSICGLSTAISRYFVSSTNRLAGRPGHHGGGGQRV